MALEPNPEVYPILRRNLNRFPQALALQLAASTVQGPVVLQVPKRITGVPELQPHLLRKALRIPSVSMWWRPNLSTPSCLSCTCKGWTSSKSMLKEQRWISFAPWVMPWKRSMRSFASCFHPTFRPLGKPPRICWRFCPQGVPPLCDHRPPRGRPPSDQALALAECCGSDGARGYPSSGLWCQPGCEKVTSSC